MVRLSQGRRSAIAAHDLFDAHLPLIRYEQQPGVGLAVRKYVLQKRGVIASAAQRKPGAAISATAKAEVDYLLARVARVDSAPICTATTRGGVTSRSYEVVIARSEATKQSNPVHGALDCFASLAMTGREPC